METDLTLSPTPAGPPDDVPSNGIIGSPTIQSKPAAAEAIKKASTPTTKKARMSVGITPKSVTEAGSAPKPKSTAKKSATPASTAAAKKRKIADLEKDVDDLKVNLEKMRKDKIKLQRAIDEQIRYPVRDDLIVSLDVKGKQPQPLPEALESLTLPEHLMNDTIRVWDFLNNFRKQMSLNAIAIDPLIDLLKFTGRTSPALTELFCAPLKLLLSDPLIAAKVSAAIPRRLNFAHRSSFAKPIIENGEQDTVNMTYTENEADFDTSYNGVRLLPRGIRADLVDPLSFQGLLRAVLLRLEPIKQLRRAAAEVPESAPIPAPLTRKSKVEDDDDATSVDGTSSSSSSKTHRRLTFSVTLEEARGSLLPDAQSSTAADITHVNSRISLEGRRTSLSTKKKNQQVNKDNLFLITSDPRQDLSAVLEAAVLLETQELHCLSIGHKLAALKAVCEACYDTQRLTDLLTSNADERAERVTAMSKLIREEKAKSKEVSVAKSAEAIERCRVVNRLAAAAASKSSKVPKNKAKESEPSAPQVAAMLEEMALLERLGVDEVIEGLPEEEPMSEDEEEDSDYTLNADGTYTMRNRASVRGKANDRKRQRVERESRLIQVNLAKDSLERAIATGGEKEVRLAIKQGVKAGLRGQNEDGTVYCTDLLKQVYKLQAALETKAKEERALSIHEKELSELCVRSTPLGSDRFHRRYWMFSHSLLDEQRLFVECDTSLACSRSAPVEVKGSSDVAKIAHVKSFPDGNTYAGTIKAYKACKKTSSDRSLDLQDYILSAATSAPYGGVNLKKDQPLCRLISSRPSARPSSWSVYSANELWALCEALDDRGERERELKAAIRSHFDISEPPVVFLKEGSEHIGQSVLRTFGKKRRVRGVIVGWLPALGDDCALWHIQHSDGDVEDLELHEVLEGVQLALQVSEAPEETAAMPERRDTRGKSVESYMELNSDEEGTDGAGNKDSDGQDEPDLVASNRSILIGNQGLKFLQLGPSGLRQELLRSQGLLLEGLKRRGSSYSKDREGRRAWENLVRNAEEVPELRSAVQELEAVVHSVQVGDDENDDVEAAREKADARAVMLTEGWRFNEAVGAEEDQDESIKEQLTFIGRKLRRFFKGHGKSDGVIVGYLPSAMNEGMELWRMEHQDGDEEDLDRQDVVKSIRWFEENLLEDDEAPVSAEEDEEEEEMDVEVEEVGRVEGETSATLWPTAGVRARWLDALQKSVTVSEVSLALCCLMEHSRCFGMMDDVDEVQPARRAAVFNKSKSAKSVPVIGASPYKRKGKSSVSDALADGGRSLRASRRVLSYAE